MMTQQNLPPVGIADGAPTTPDGKNIQPTPAPAAAMPAGPPPAQPKSPATRTYGTPHTYTGLVSSFSSFLAVSMHQILFLRSIYPASTFLPVRQYNHPVKQSRHPRVCSWITEACTAVELQLLRSAISAVSFVIVNATTHRPMERYTFDISQLPRVAPGDILTPFASSANATRMNHYYYDAATGYGVDVEAQFRAVLARLASACARLTPLSQKDEYHFSVFITLHPDADAPAGVTVEEQMWIPAEPDNDLSAAPIENMQSEFPDRKAFGSGATPSPHDREPSGLAAAPQPRAQRAQTVPVRRVEAGEMKMEVWIEEAVAKFDRRPS